uniref:Uncharacterized protein n=1 Tax=Ananas comosus var. bracteatus TaxID=296719 RepID=A0A6V7P978_ANACO|nr:unnamed protein product [Ananas comosus var. bracteatus]
MVEVEGEVLEAWESAEEGLEAGGVIRVSSASTSASTSGLQTEGSRRWKRERRGQLVPADGYFIAVAVNCEAALVVGNLRSEAYRRAAARAALRGEALLISRLEHVAMRRDVRSGVRSYATLALEETSD